MRIAKGRRVSATRHAATRQMCATHAAALRALPAGDVTLSPEDMAAIAETLERAARALRAMHDDPPMEAAHGSH